MNHTELATKADVADLKLEVRKFRLAVVGIMLLFSVLQVAVVVGVAWILTR